MPSQDELVQVILAELRSKHQIDLRPETGVTLSVSVQGTGQWQGGPGCRRVVPISLLSLRGARGCGSGTGRALGCVISERRAQSRRKQNEQ